MRILRLLCLAAVTAAAAAAGADPQPAPPPPDSDDLYKLGKQLFDQYAPPDIKQQYDFPTKDQWDQFAARLQKALDNNSLQDLAEFEPEARSALAALQAIPGYEDYARWLSMRIDEIEAAKQAVALRAPTAPPPPGVERAASSIPLYDLWLGRIRDRPVPDDAADLMPRLRADFSAEGVPPDLAWIAEAESTLDPGARSPSGAKGLFQLMPETARNLGLSTFFPDDRTDPDKSARASARYLRTLYGKFGSWPLALAAYNAGEGRVRRLLASRGASSFAEVSPALPSQTRMYVPKVLAIVDVRTGTSPEALPPPGA